MIVCDDVVNLNISIHAPPRGATALGAWRSVPVANFNSRPSARGDHRRHRPRQQRSISIHAPPRGATLCDGVAVGGEHFNSRPSARGDTLVWIEDNNGDISIHAPPRGATDVSPDSEGKLYIFQFTPLREGRPPDSAACCCRILISIHAPPRGATIPIAPTHTMHQFQFTPLREGRLFRKPKQQQSH